MPRPKQLVIPSRVPARLRSLVEASGKTQVEIADAIGWSKQQLHQSLSGARPTLSIETAAKILIATGNDWSALNCGGS